MKRIVSGAVLVASLIAFIGCSDAKSGQAGGKQQKKEVSFFTWWGDAEKTFGEALIADYEAANPGIKVTQNFVPYSDFHSKINTMIVAGSAPDVFLLNEYLINEWGEKGIVADLNPYYAKKGIVPEDYYLPNYLFTTGGKLWGVGSNPALIVLYYNKELFRQAGIAEPPTDVESPWTWDQFVDAAKKLTKDSSGKTASESGFSYDSVVQYGTLVPSNWLYWAPLLYGSSLSVVNDDGTGFAMSSDAGAKIIQSAADLALKDKVAPGYAMAQGSAFSNFPILLMNGQLAMFIGGSFVIGDFNNEKYDIGIAQIPSFSGKGMSMTWASGFQMKAGASDDAFDFYLYMTDFNNWVAAAKKHNLSLPGGLPTTVSTFNDPEKRAAWQSVSNETMSRVAADILQKAARLGENVTVKNWAELSDQIIVPEFDKVWLGEETAAQAMGNINQAANGKFQGVWK